MKVRRVVTGTDAGGKSVFASDTTVDGITLELVPGYEWHRLWGVEGGAVLPDDGSPRPPLDAFPGVHGFRFGLLSIGPDSIAISDDIDLVEALEEMETKLPGMSAYQEQDDPSMHQTPTVDFLYIVSGRIVVELDDGVSVELGPGDTLVQNGARHAWRNPFDEPCQMVTVLIGADRSPR